MAGGPGGSAWGPAADSSRARGALAGNAIVRDLTHVGTVGSTQDVALELATVGARSGTVVIADHQRAGRGRSGNRWEDDPAGGSLALSLLLDVGTTLPEPTSVPLVPHALGLAVTDACAAVGPAARALRLKWPNDVVLRDDVDGPARKIAGILVERDRIRGPAGDRDLLRCGIGLNVALTAPLPPDRVDLATVLGPDPDRAVLLAALVTALDATLVALADPARLLERIRSMSDTIGRRVRVSLPGERSLIGIATAIDDRGRLLVTSGGSSRAILSGSVRDAEDPDGGGAP